MSYGGDDDGRGDKPWVRWLIYLVIILVANIILIPFGFRIIPL